MKNRKSNIKRQKNKISRRVFISGSAAAVASITIVPRHILGGAGKIPPSEKLNIAGIGVGGQGRWDLDNSTLLIVAIQNA